MRDEAGGDPVEAGLGERAEAWRRAVMRPGEQAISRMGPPEPAGLRDLRIAGVGRAAARLGGVASSSASRSVGRVGNVAGAGAVGQAGAPGVRLSALTGEAGLGFGMGGLRPVDVALRQAAVRRQAGDASGAVGSRAGDGRSDGEGRSVTAPRSAGSALEDGRKRGATGSGGLRPGHLLGAGPVLGRAGLGKEVLGRAVLERAVLERAGLRLEAVGAGARSGGGEAIAGSGTTSGGAGLGASDRIAGLGAVSPMAAGVQGIGGRLGSKLLADGVAAMPAVGGVTGSGFAGAPGEAGGSADGGGRGQVASAFPAGVAGPVPSGGGGGGGVVMLDGRMVGRWLAERMGREAERAPAGMTRFDARQSAAWRPSGAM